MDGAKFIQSIRLENILSYGPNSEPFQLEPLNVLIGPNAFGQIQFNRKYDSPPSSTSGYPGADKGRRWC